MTTRLRELLVKATKGPWLICRSYFNNVETGYHITGPEHGSVFPICRKQYETGESNEQAQANAALIVEAVNTLPALLDALDEARWALEWSLPYVERLRDGIRIREALAKIDEVKRYR